MVLSFGGAEIGVRCNDVAVLAQLERRFSLAWSIRRCGNDTVEHLYSLKVGAPARRPGVRNYHLVHAGTAQIARTLDLEEAVRALEQSLLGDLGFMAQDGLFLKAGVCVSQGAALVITGESGAGTSTLLDALVRQGATYYSDAYAVINDEGLVCPFSVPFPSFDGKRAADEPVDLGAFLWMQYQPHVEGVDLSRLPLGMAALKLTARCLGLTAQRMTQLAKLVERTPFWEGVRGDSALASRHLLQTLGT